MLCGMEMDEDREFMVLWFGGGSFYVEWYGRWCKSKFIYMILENIHDSWDMTDTDWYSKMFENGNRKIFFPVEPLRVIEQVGKRSVFGS